MKDAWAEWSPRVHSLQEAVILRSIGSKGVQRQSPPHGGGTGRLAYVGTGRVHRCYRVDEPRSFLRRHFGLLARSPLAADEVLHLHPCGSIHSWFLAAPIDAIFLDTEFRVLAVRLSLAPWRIGVAPRGTRSVLEARAGAFSGVSVGERVRFQAQSRIPGAERPPKE